MQDDGYRRDVELLLEHCAEHRVAVQTIKAVARRRWEDGDDRPHFSWYEPLNDSDALERAVRYVLGRPGLFLNTTSDARLLRPILEAAAGLTPGGGQPSDEEMAADTDRLGVVSLFDGAELERI
jgi:hypothetical protein